MLREQPFISNNTTLRVGSTRQFTTIQTAMNSLVGIYFVNDMTLLVDDGTYAENISFARFQGRSLTIKAAVINELYGFGYQNGKVVTANTKTTNSGEGTQTITNSGNDVTVTCTTTNPDFVAAGVDSTHSLIFRNDAGGFSKIAVASVAANVITLVSAAPALAGALAGFVLTPSVIIEGTVGADGVAISEVSNLSLQGLLFNDNSSVALSNIDRLDITQCVLFDNNVGNVWDIDNCNRVTMDMLGAFVLNGQSYAVEACGSFTANRILSFASAITAITLFCGAVQSVVINDSDFVGTNARSPIYPGGFNFSRGRSTITDCHFKNLETIILIGQIGYCGIVTCVLDTGNVGIQAQAGSNISVLLTEVKNQIAAGHKAENNSFINVVLPTLSGNGADYDPAVSGTEGNNDSIIIHA